MNPILQSFLCGAAFIGGAVAVLVLMACWSSIKDQSSRKEMMEFWRESLKNGNRQIAIIERIADQLEKQNGLTKELYYPERKAK